MSFSETDSTDAPAVNSRMARGWTARIRSFCPVGVLLAVVGGFVPSANAVTITDMHFADMAGNPVACAPSSGQFQVCADVRNDSILSGLISSMILTIDGPGLPTVCSQTSIALLGSATTEFCCTHTIVAGEECGPWDADLVIASLLGGDTESISCNKEGDSCDDGLFCTINDACSAGDCDGDARVCIGDGNACTEEICNEVTQCSPIAVADATACDDGDACTMTDQCTSGVCGGAALDCDDEVSCTTDSCVAGQCVHDSAACICLSDSDCNDGNPCTADSCGPQGTCVVVDAAGSCDDGNACTINDACSGGACVGSAMQCSDGADCTDDSCVSGVCIHDDSNCTLDELLDLDEILDSVLDDDDSGDDTADDGDNETDDENDAGDDVDDAANDDNGSDLGDLFGGGLDTTTLTEGGITIHILGLDPDTLISTETDENEVTRTVLGNPLEPDFVFSIDSDVEGDQISALLEDLSKPTLAIADSEGLEKARITAVGLGTPPEIAVVVTGNTMSVNLMDGSGSNYLLDIINAPQGAVAVYEVDGNDVTISVKDPANVVVGAELLATTVTQNFGASFEFSDVMALGTESSRLYSFEKADGIGGVTKIEAENNTSETVYRVSLQFQQAQIDASVDEHPRLYQFAAVSQQFRPAGDVDIGQDPPTATLGHYGFNPSSREVWAALDEVGRFAVGLPKTAGVAPTSSAGCGAGACGSGAAAMIPLMFLSLRSMRRRARRSA